MKETVERRAVRLGEYIVESGDTVRSTADRFGISKSTVHKDVTKGNGERNGLSPLIFAQKRLILHKACTMPFLWYDIYVIK